MSWFSIVEMRKADGKASARIDIYDQIGQSVNWFTGEKVGIAARDFSAALNALGDVSEIELHINSPGGLVMDGLQIFNELVRHKATINVVIDAQAASIASVIAMAGDTVTMPENATFWIHNPVAMLREFMAGNSKELREKAQKAIKLAGDLDTLTDSIVSAYARRSSLSRDELKALMDEESLITAEKAIEIGFADTVEESMQAAACADLDKALEDVIAAESEAFLPVENAGVEVGLGETGEIPGDLVGVVENGPAAMDPISLVSLMREKGAENLALYCIEQQMTENQAKAFADQAGEIRGVLKAAGIEDFAEPCIEAFKSGSIEMARFFAQKWAENEKEVDGFIGAGNREKGPVINIEEVYRQRRNMK